MTYYSKFKILGELQRLALTYSPGEKITVDAEFIISVYKFLNELLGAMQITDTESES